LVHYNRGGEWRGIDGDPNISLPAAQSSNAEGKTEV